MMGIYLKMVFVLEQQIVLMDISIKVENAYNANRLVYLMDLKIVLLSQVHVIIVYLVLIRKIFGRCLLLRISLVSNKVSTLTMILK